MSAQTNIVEIHDWAFFTASPQIEDEFHGKPCLAQFVPAMTGNRFKGHYRLLGVIDWESISADESFSFELGEGRYRLGNRGPERDSNNQPIPVKPFGNQDDLAGGIRARALQADLYDPDNRERRVIERRTNLGL